MAGLAFDHAKKLRRLSCAFALLLLVLFVLLGSARADFCSDSLSRMGACRSYVLGATSSVPESCCRQVRALHQSTSGQTQKRRQICGCFKKFAGFLNARNTAALPRACGVNLGYPISASTDCNRIN